MLEILYGAVDENTQISMCELFKANICPDGFCSHKNRWDSKKHLVNEELLIFLMNNYYLIYWVVCAKLIKKEIIEKHPFTSGRIYEDGAVVFKWINEAENVNVIEEKLYFYRVNSDSTTQTDFSLKNLDRLWAIEEQINFYENTSFNNMKKNVYINYAIACANIYNRLLEDKMWAKDAQKLKKKLKSFIREKRKFIEFNEDWVFSLVDGVLYPKPIRAILRLKRYVKNITK